MLYNKAKAARDEALAQTAKLEDQRARDAAAISLLETERDRLLSEERAIKRTCQEAVDRAEQGRREAEKATAQAREEGEWDAQRCKDALQELERLRRACSDFVRRVRGLLLGVEETGEDYFEREHMDQLCTLVKEMMEQRERDKRDW